MEFSSFTFFMTEDCNFDCSYCYQRKEKKYIDSTTLEKAIDFFLPFFLEECYINFYGGEPLLAYEQILHAVNYIQEKTKMQKKKLRYAITTNGSLITDEILKFLNRHNFSLLLSFDGIAQDKFRKRGSFKKIVSVIKKIQKNPNIRLETNSVFTPASVGYLSKSIRSIVELGVPNLDTSVSPIFSWESASLTQLRKELTSLRGYLISHNQETGQIPFVKFRKESKRGVFACYAGRDGMAMSPHGRLWGCHLFLDYYKDKAGTQEYAKYCFGDLDAFIESYKIIYPEILSNYSGLRMDRFLTSDSYCIRCDELMECTICPMNNVLSGYDIRMVPPWACEIQKIFRMEKKRFWEEIGEES
jgi:uncharacterized protein